MKKSWCVLWAGKYGIYRISFHLTQYFEICRAQKIRFPHLNFSILLPLVLC